MIFMAKTVYEFVRPGRPNCKDLLAEIGTEPSLITYHGQDRVTIEFEEGLDTEKKNKLKALFPNYKEK